MLGGSFKNVEKRWLLIENFLSSLSGNWNHPLDIIYNATLSFRPVFKLADDLEAKYKCVNGNYIANEFLINEGKVEGSLKEFGAITHLRIDFKSNLDNWVLISEIMIKPKLD